MIVMCSILTLILAKSDYIDSANTVLFNLNEYEDSFEMLASVLNYAKCTLIRNEELEDFYINGIYVSCYNKGDGYDLLYDDYKLTIEVYDNQIIDYDLNR